MNAKQPIGRAGDFEECGDAEDRGGEDEDTEGEEEYEAGGA